MPSFDAALLLAEPLFLSLGYNFFDYAAAAPAACVAATSTST